MQDVFLQQRESNLLSNAGHAAEITEQVFTWCFLPQREVNLPSNAGHAAEITEQVFMWCFLPQREVNLPSNAGHAAEITEQVSLHHLLPTSYLCALQERIIMNKLKIYFANQPNSKGLVHSTFLPLNPVSRNQGTTISETNICSKLLLLCVCVFV